VQVPLKVRSRSRIGLALFRPCYSDSMRTVDAQNQYVICPSCGLPVPISRLRQIPPDGGKGPNPDDVCADCLGDVTVLPLGSDRRSHRCARESALWRRRTRSRREIHERPALGLTGSRRLNYQEDACRTSMLCSVTPLKRLWLN
jgi:hypothetical protein